MAGAPGGPAHQFFQPNSFYWVKVLRIVFVGQIMDAYHGLSAHPGRLDILAVKNVGLGLLEQVGKREANASDWVLRNRRKTEAGVILDLVPRGRMRVQDVVLVCALVLRQPLKQLTKV